MDPAPLLARHLDRFESALDRLTPPAETRPARLHAAMRYSLEAGGKRLRPILCLAAAEMCGTLPDDALPAAVALECVHTYSLIHDDLPCLDNDDLRRGRPTLHRAFDEATALLAGDALLTHAFVLLSTAHAARPGLAHALIRELADAAGSRRLIGGQMEDVLAEQRPDVSAADLEFIHRNKTAAMLEASLVMGGLVAGAPDSTLAALRRAGGHLGLCFQIVDDVLDATADQATLGKTPGKDARAGKATYVSLHGLKTARQLAVEQTEAALRELAAIPGDSAFLRALVASLAHRER
ncbi:MAG: polyprenyl synthetase family protein [Opitutaceae bacterium]